MNRGEIGDFSDWLWHIKAVFVIPIAWVVCWLLEIFGGKDDKMAR